MARRVISRARACAQCGVTPITGYRFCGKQCRETARERARGCRPIELVKAERRAAALRTCQVCGAAFLKNGGGKGTPGKYCSKGCMAIAYRKFDPVDVVQRRLARLARFEKRREDRELKAARVALLDAIICYVHNPALPCADCGIPMGRRHTNGSYCPACAKARERRQRRVAKGRRRALMRGATCERIDPIEVFERDGWRCHLCHRSTPARWRGTYKRRAPELDHIVPLSRGGAHTRGNVACACRECNGAKGNRVIGQPSLFAAMQ